MLPLRLVVDTNIVVSALLKPDGLERTVLLLALTKPARLYLSSEIFAEYREVLARPVLKIRKGQRLQLLQLMRNNGYFVIPTRRVRVATDVDDDIFLECAEAARADYLITGNRRHFPKYWKQTEVVSARDFMDEMSPKLI